MPAHILVVEDEPAIQELIGVNLEQAGQRAVMADSAEQALESIREELPDLVLLDWMLPGQSGLELARRLRADARTKALPIIILTARGDEEDKLRGLETGADDYITKPFSVKELQARIRAVLRRRAPENTDDVIDYHGLRLDPASHRVTGKGRELTMGPTEFRLLHFFMTHSDRVYSRAQILDQVWGDHVFIEERTVDVHIRRLRNVLACSHLEAFVQTIRGTGYRFSRT